MSSSPRWFQRPTHRENSAEQGHHGCRGPVSHGWCHSHPAGPGGKDAHCAPRTTHRAPRTVHHCSLQCPKSPPHPDLSASKRFSGHPQTHQLSLMLPPVGVTVSVPLVLEGPGEQDLTPLVLAAWGPLWGSEPMARGPRVLPPPCTAVDHRIIQHPESERPSKVIKSNCRPCTWQPQNSHRVAGAGAAALGRLPGMGQTRCKQTRGLCAAPAAVPGSPPAPAAPCPAPAPPNAGRARRHGGDASPTCSAGGRGRCGAWGPRVLGRRCPARHGPGGRRVPAHSWRRKGAAGGRTGIFRSFFSLSAEMTERPGFICHSSAAAPSRRRRVMSLRHSPMPSGQNAMRSLGSGEDGAASESRAEPSTPPHQQRLTALWLRRSADARQGHAGLAQR